MTKNILTLLAIIIATALWTYFSDTKPIKRTSALEKVPNFEFNDITETKHALYDFQGRVVLLHFWATWCAPCLEELPDLIDLAQTQSEEMTVIAIAVQDKPDDIQRFLTKTKRNIPENFIVGLDPNQVISKNIYETIKLPETYIIDLQLTLSEKITGAKNDWGRYRYED